MSPHFGSPPAAELLRQQFILALDGELDVIALAASAATATPRSDGTTRAGEAPDAVPINRAPAPPRILWFDGTAPGEFVVQIRSTDRAGLLARLTAVIERDGVDIAWAKVTTLGSSVVDAFGIVVPSLARQRAPMTRPQAAVRDELERDLYAVLPTPAAREAGVRGQLVRCQLG